MSELHGFVADLDEATYHAHPTSLSVSGAKVLLKAPALYQWQRTHPVHKDVFDFGSAAHRLVLGVGPDVLVCPFDNWATKDAKAMREDARSKGEIPVLTKDWERVLVMADTLSDHSLAMQLLSGGRPEVSGFAMDEETGVLRRCRFDYLKPNIGVDYKSAASSDPAIFVKAAVTFGYHMQEAFYSDVAYDLGHPLDAFAFVAQEKEPPYIVTVVELPAELVAVGRSRNRRALERFRDCTASGVWPGYIPDTEFAQPAAPTWAIREEWVA